MNDELEELYQQVILEHAKRPRNRGELGADALRVDGDNPSCGDEIHLHVKFAPDGAVEDIRFTGHGCAISQASASLMTLKVKGRPQGEVASLSRRFAELVAGGGAPDETGFGDLALLRGVRKFPQRVKCAMLAWRALDQALAGHAGTVSTESGDE
jgi:nitrogen fixation NifU-like protein